MDRAEKLMMLFSISMLISTYEQQAISWARVWDCLPVRVVKRIGYVLCKVTLISYWQSYTELHGNDYVSQREEERRSGACAINMPASVVSTPPIAPETVTDLLKQRIADLKASRFAWPVCKPILLTGAVGMGKTQLARYLAQQTGCHFMYSSAAGFMSSKENAGVETVATLFKRSRIRSEISAWTLRLRQLLAYIFRRPKPQKKPTIILIDEFDSISMPSGHAREGDEQLEIERSKTFDRLCWEISYNRYAQDSGLPAHRCPPADYLERFMVLWIYGISSDQDHTDTARSEFLANHKRAWPFLWQYLLGRKQSESLVVAATNSPWYALDPAVPRYFDIVEIPQLDASSRRAIIQFHAHYKQFQEGILDDLVNKTAGFCADRIAAVINDAALIAADKQRDVIRQEDVAQAIQELHIGQH